MRNDLRFRRDDSRLWLGLFIGAAAGAALAVLITSDKGKEIIGDLKDDIKDTAGKAESEVKRALHNLEETMHRGKDLAGKLEKKAGKFLKHTR